ncbi:hypothetical protein [Serratia plymuthica]|uniref:hypothetical protein n=1 Tax=Serratia plymuthica TaxID=82996 RepID=UPI0014199AB0|nr:hypothetical protein [Serratia plymuthica]NIC29319.1 hypothetical protein [Serratia plymuthica]
MAKRVSTQMVSDVFVKKKVAMWFVPRRFADQVIPGTKIHFWNIGDYYGRIRRLSERG